MTKRQQNIYGTAQIIVGDVTDGTVTKCIRGLQLISSKNGSNENFYTYNGHGDVVQLTNSAAAITSSMVMNALSDGE